MKLQLSLPVFCSWARDQNTETSPLPMVLEVMTLLLEDSPSPFCHSDPGCTPPLVWGHRLEHWSPLRAYVTVPKGFINLLKKINEVVCILTL